MEEKGPPKVKAVQLYHLFWFSCDTLRQHFSTVFHPVLNSCTYCRRQQNIPHLVQICLPKNPGVCVSKEGLNRPCSCACTAAMMWGHTEVMKTYLLRFLARFLRACVVLSDVFRVPLFFCPRALSRELRHWRCVMPVLCLIWILSSAPLCPFFVMRVFFPNSSVPRFVRTLNVYRPPFSRDAAKHRLLRVHSMCLFPVRRFVRILLMRSIFRFPSVRYFCSEFCACAIFVKAIRPCVVLS